MDIEKYNTRKGAENTFKVVLNDPATGIDLEHEGRGMYALVVGKDSKEYRASISRLVNAEKNKKAKDEFNYSKEEVKGANLLASCTKELVFFAGGKWHEYKIEGDDADKVATHAKIRDAYLKYAWMKEDIDSEIGDRANFFGQGSNS